MAEAAAVSTGTDTEKKKRGIGKLLLPVALLIVGTAAGGAGMWFAQPMLQAQDGLPKKPPVVAPLEYIEIDNNFTASFRDTGRYVQLRIAISTNGGPPVVDAVNRHKLAIVAAALTVLADARQADVDAPGGRDRLARDMRMAINDVLQRKSGLAGVEDVLVTSFIVQ